MIKKTSKKVGLKTDEIINNVLIGRVNKRKQCQQKVSEAIIEMVTAELGSLHGYNTDLFHYYFYFSLLCILVFAVVRYFLLSMHVFSSNIAWY